MPACLLKSLRAACAWGMAQGAALAQSGPALEPTALTFPSFPRRAAGAFLHQRAPRHAGPAHAMGQPRGAEADLGQFQPVADFHQPVPVGNFQPVEGKLAITAMFLRSHDRDTAQDFPARLVGIEQEGRQPLAGIVRCPRNQ